MMQQIMESYSLIYSTFPLWLSTFAILKSKYQIEGINKSSLLKDIVDKTIVKNTFETTDKFSAWKEWASKGTADMGPL